MRSALASVFKKVKKTITQSSKLHPISDPVTKEVEAYYDRETGSYLETYGKLIQAAKPASDAEFISYLINSIGLEDGMRVLDAGCGVCGPAIEFAKVKKLQVEGITISKVQVAESEKNISEANLAACIKVTRGDFAELDKFYQHNSFDKVIYLETLGYANNLKKSVSGAVKVLKPGGSVYIKDFFLVPILEPEKKKIQHEFCEQVRTEYLYKVLDLVELITILRELGMYIEFVKSINLVEDFTKAAYFEMQNTSHTVYTAAINNPFQIFEPLEVRFKKIH